MNKNIINFVKESKIFGGIHIMEMSNYFPTYLVNKLIKEGTLKIVNNRLFAA